MQRVSFVLTEKRLLKRDSLFFRKNLFSVSKAVQNFREQMDGF